MLRSRIFAIFVILAGCRPFRVFASNLEIAEQIRDQIGTQLEERGLHSNYFVGVRVLAGTATLTGNVKNQEQMDLVVKTAKRHREVREVRNELRIDAVPPPQERSASPAAGRIPAPEPAPRQASSPSERRLNLRDTLRGHTQPVCCVAFSPNGKTLASGSKDTKIKLWDVPNGKNIATLEGYTGIVDSTAFCTGVVSSVAFSPDGKTLASGAHDSTLRIWGVTSHKEVAMSEGRLGEAVAAIAFSPNGKGLAVGRYNTTIELWDVEPAKETKK